MVKIRLKAGEATINDLEWSTPVKDLLPVLNSYIDPNGYSPADPDPDFTVARLVVKELGGKIITYDPPPPGPNLVY